MRLPLYRTTEVPFLLAGTGLGPGDVLPQAVCWFAAGNRVAFDVLGRSSIGERGELAY